MQNTKDYDEKDIDVRVFRHGQHKKIANLFSDEFIKNGVETTIVDIKKGARIKCVDDFDAVGVCYPIHGFNAPYNVLEFAHDMPKTHDKPLFVLKSSGEPLALNNVSSYKLVSILKKKDTIILRNTTTLCRTI